jgi:hypothetical protein
MVKRLEHFQLRRRSPALRHALKCAPFLRPGATRPRRRKPQPLNHLRRLPSANRSPPQFRLLSASAGRHVRPVRPAGQSSALSYHLNHFSPLGDQVVGQSTALSYRACAGQRACDSLVRSARTARPDAPFTNLPKIGSTACYGGEMRGGPASSEMKAVRHARGIVTQRVRKVLTNS